MAIRNVLREDWVTFFQTFTSDHLGLLVSLGIDGQHPDKHDTIDIEARELPLREITANLRNKEGIVVISLGVSGDNPFWHVIESVFQVRVVTTGDGSKSALTIASLNGQTTTLVVKHEYLTDYTRTRAAR